MRTTTRPDPVQQILKAALETTSPTSKQTSESNLVSSLLEAVSKALPEVDPIEVNEEAARLIRAQAAELIADLSKTKQKTVKSLLARAVEQGWTDATLKRRLKEVIGLDSRRAMAVQNYRSGLIAGGMSPGRAERMAQSYAKRLLRARLDLIADQELRQALRNAQRLVWKRMQDDGELSRYAVRVTRVHKDERLCAICRPQNGVRRSLQRDLTKGPPFHPQCRCDEVLEDQGVVKTDPDLVMETGEMDDDNDNPYCVFGDHGSKPFHETNEHDEVVKVSSRAYPSLERVPGKQNWVDRAGGLPSYIERIAKHLHYERGMSVGRAIATAVSQCRKWAAGGENVTTSTRAKAAKAIAQWEAKKKRSKVNKLDDTFKFADLLASKERK